MKIIRYPLFLFIIILYCNANLAFAKDSKFFIGGGAFYGNNKQLFTKYYGPNSGYPNSIVHLYRTVGGRAGGYFKFGIIDDNKSIYIEYQRVNYNTSYILQNISLGYDIIISSEYIVSPYIGFNIGLSRIDLDPNWTESNFPEISLGGAPIYSNDVYYPILRGSSYSICGGLRLGALVFLTESISIDISYKYYWSDIMEPFGFYPIFESFIDIEVEHGPQVGVNISF